MKGYVVVSPEGKYVAESTHLNMLELVEDINKAAVHEDDNVELPEGFRLQRVNVIKTIIPDVEFEIVEHITQKEKLLRGVIRKDITLSQAKSIDPYAFPKDGGYFIREKYLSIA